MSLTGSAKRLSQTPAKTTRTSESVIFVVAMLRDSHALKRRPHNRDRVAYQFNDRSLTKTERGALLPALKAHLDNTGSEEVRIKLQKVWDYFPHYGLRDVRKRYTYRRLARQGELSTWWIGSSNCFESVLDVTAYNELLVEHLIRK